MFRGIGPVALAVVDDEFAVRWHPARLDGTQVIAGDLRSRKVIGKLDRPDARPSADIQDALDVLRYGRAV